MSNTRDPSSRRAEFRFRTGLLLAGIALFGGGGALMAAATWNQPLRHGHHHLLDLRLLENDLVAALGLAIAVFLLLALLARPRLVAGYDGVRDSGFLRHRHLSWDRLGRFAVVEHPGGQHRRVEAVLLPPKGFTAAPSRFVIRDVYDVPPETIARTIEAVRHEHGIEPAARAPAPEAMEPLGLQGLAVPWITLSLTLVMFAIFVVELGLHGAPARGVVSRHVLIAFGGLTRVGVLERGEWLRLLTATYLHASFAHIMGNTVVLLLIGWRLEKLVGHAWLAAAFVLSAAAGWLLSLAVLPPGIVAVGASGGIMGLLACAFVMSFRLPEGDPERRRLQVWALRIAIPALLPLQGLHGGLVTDYAAHTGGLVAGYGLALILLATWRQQARSAELGWRELREVLRGQHPSTLPPARRLALVIALVGFGGTIVAALRVARSGMG